MAPFNLFFLLHLLLIPTTCYIQPYDGGFISGVISNKGIDFAKDLLIEKGIESIVLLNLPEIENSAQVPLVGKAKVVLSHITIKDIQVNSSSVMIGESGIVVVVSGATADLSMKWNYTVKGMQVGLTLSLKNKEGRLKLSLLDHGCYVGDLSIKLDGGAAWLYQLLVDAFEENIASSVEEGISGKIKEGITKLQLMVYSQEQAKS
ncbi:hypothetical protein RYX36_016423 [Vicia faba]